jgi:hypothetical protein
MNSNNRSFNEKSDPTTRSIVIIGWILIMFGAIDILGTLAANTLSLIHSGRSVKWGGGLAIMALAGAGLLRRSSVSRSLVLFFCWTEFIGVPILLGLAIFTPDSVTVSCAGFHSTAAESPVLCFSALVSSFVFAAFIYRKLTSAEIVACFSGQSPKL